MTLIRAIGSVWRLLVVFFLCISIAYVLFLQLFSKQPNLGKILTWNMSFEDIQKGDVSAALRQAMDENYSLALTCFACVFFIKQTFAIPGSALLNIIAGVLLPIHVAFPLVCILTTCGASTCYILSSTLGSHDGLVSLTDYFLPGKLNMLQAQIDEARREQRLFYVLLFLRIFPFSPNWLLNMASPYLNIPLYLFSPSVFIGLMPYNFVTVKAGSMLSSIHSLRDVFDIQTVFGFLFLAGLMLVPCIEPTPMEASFMDDLIDEFDSPSTPVLNPSIQKDKHAGNLPNNASVLRRYPSLSNSKPINLGANVNDSMFIPSYPKLTTADEPKARRMDLPSAPIVTFNESVPITKHVANSLEAHTNDTKSHKLDTTLGSCENALDNSLDTQTDVDVEQELHSLQQVMNHVDLALRGETPHQIEQREIREKARQEREYERLQRKIAMQEQHMQRVEARLAKSRGEG